MRLWMWIALLCLPHAAVAESPPVDLGEQVREAEKAFARTMAERDHGAFVSFLAEEAVFLSRTYVSRGKQAVADRWKTYFEGEVAPFSWAPETVEVLDSGELAISTGPVWGSRGQRISTYTSIWRLEEPGVWRIIFDKGDKYCE
ncbi:MAG: nuclear transport factor 2 family protein [Acidobacteriota bacterium]